MKRSIYVVVAVIATAAIIGACYAPVQPQPQPQPGPEGASVNTAVFRAVDVINDLDVGGVVYGTSSVVFEGATDDASETTFTVTDATADRTFTFPDSSGTIAVNPAAGDIVFEGTTADDFETTLAVTDPTADNTATIPNETAALMVSSLTTNATDAANAVTGQSNALRFEGATANDFELIVTPADITADRTVTLADGPGTVVLSSLATNAVDAANAVTGASNAWVFEGATANNFETSVAPTDATADRTITLPDATGTVVVTPLVGDMTISADTTGGNAGAKNEYIGLPRIKLVGLAQGVNGTGETTTYIDTTPTGEWAEVDGGTNLAVTADTTTYRATTNSVRLNFTDVVDNEGVDGTITEDDLSGNESIGFWIYSDTAISSGDFDVTLDDTDGTDQAYTVGAVPANAWTWVELDISGCDANCNTTDGIKFLATAQGGTALTAANVYLDAMYKWDADNEDALGTAIIQDGVLNIVDTEGGGTAVEWTDFFVNYEATVDFVVYITDQSAKDMVALIAY